MSILWPQSRAAIYESPPWPIWPGGINSELTYMGVHRNSSGLSVCEFLCDYNQAHANVLQYVDVQIATMVDQINKRIDKALASNRRTEILVIVMAACIFLLGMTIVI